MKNYADRLEAGVEKQPPRPVQFFKSYENIIKKNKSSSCSIIHSKYIQPQNIKFSSSKQFLVRAHFPERQLVTEHSFSITRIVYQTWADVLLASFVAPVHLFRFRIPREIYLYYFQVCSAKADAGPYLL